MAKLIVQIATAVAARAQVRTTSVASRRKAEDVIHGPESSRQGACGVFVVCDEVGIGEAASIESERLDEFVSRPEHCALGEGAPEPGREFEAMRRPARNLKTGVSANRV